MSQFLIVCGGRPEQRLEWSTRACGAAATLWGGEPPQRIEDGPVVVLRFQAGSHEEHDNVPGRQLWAVSCGAPFLGRLPGEGVLPELLETRGQPDWLQSIDGAFVIALGGPAPGTLQVVTDRLGTLHCYRTRVPGGGWLLSTSSLLLALLTRPEWDVYGVRQFLAYGNVFEDRTLYAGIEKLQPARVLGWSEESGWSERVYWDVRDVYWDRATRRGGVEELAGELHEAMSRIAQREPNLVLDLTGGFDSRAVLGAALGANLRPATVVAGKPDDGDVVSSRAIAQAYGLQHEVIAPEAETAAEWLQAARRAVLFTDGEADVLLYGRVLRIHEGLRARFRLSVNGSNGEIAKGYWWELLAPRVGQKHAFDARLVASRRFAVEGDVPGLIDAHFATSLVDDFTGIIERATSGMAEAPNTALMDHVYLTLRMQRWQGRLASATGRLWPFASPFCFRGPMEAALGTAPEERLRYRMSRRLLEFQDPKLARLPMAGGYPATPVLAANLPSHWRLALEWAGKVARYGRKRLGVPALTAAPAAQEALWAVPGFSQLLEPSEMVSAPLYDRARLREVLSPANRPGWARLGRMVTLELLAQRLAGVN